MWPTNLLSDMVSKGWYLPLDLILTTFFYRFCCYNVYSDQPIQKKIIMNLLCVSCSSTTEFSAISFWLFARSSSNSPPSFQRLRRTLTRNFKWIRQQMKIFPIDPHCKNCPLSATLKRWRKRAIFTMGVYGEIIYPLSDLNEIWYQSSSKTFQWWRRIWAWSGKM